MVISRRGQITLYVIIAIVVVASILLLYTFRGTIFKPALSAEEAQKLVTSQIQPVRDRVESCMEIVARKTLNTQSRQGGYVLPKSERAAIPSKVMPDAPPVAYALYYENNQSISFLPSVTEMKDDFLNSMAVNPDFEMCMNEFSDFNNIVDVESGTLSIDRANMDFGEKSGMILIPFKYPIRISKGNATDVVDDYSVKMPINIEKVHEKAALIINSISRGDNFIIMLQDMAKQQESDLRKDPGSGSILAYSYYYEDLMAVGTEGNSIYDKNLLFKLVYENEALQNPYEFYFLVKQK